MIDNRSPVIIPATSPTCYLGGMAALNLLSDEGTGDWHAEGTFFIPRGPRRARSFISGAGCDTDTMTLLGDAGIFDATAIVDAMGILHVDGPVYAATHARAIADLVLGAVLRQASPDFVILDDWMPRDSDKQQVFDLLAVALPRLSPDHQHAARAWQEKQGRG